MRSISARLALVAGIVFIPYLLVLVAGLVFAIGTLTVATVAVILLVRPSVIERVG